MTRKSNPFFFFFLHIGLLIYGVRIIILSAYRICFEIREISPRAVVLCLLACLLVCCFSVEECYSWKVYVPERKKKNGSLRLLDVLHNPYKIGLGRINAASCSSSTDWFSAFSVVSFDWKMAHQQPDLFSCFLSSIFVNADVLDVLDLVLKSFSCRNQLWLGATGGRGAANQRNRNKSKNKNKQLNVVYYAVDIGPVKLSSWFNLGRLWSFLVNDLFIHDSRMDQSSAVLWRYKRQRGWFHYALQLDLAAIDER